MDIEKIKNIVKDCLDYVSPVKPSSIEDIQLYTENFPDGIPVYSFEYEGEYGVNKTISFQFYVMGIDERVDCEVHVNAYDDRSVDEYNSKPVVEIKNMLDEREIHSKLRDIVDYVDTLVGNAIPD